MGREEKVFLKKLTVVYIQKGLTPLSPYKC